MDEVRCIRTDELRDGPATPGMHRWQAIADGGVWAGVVDTEPGLASGWHHHGSHQTAFYVMTGRIRMEFGPGGGKALEAGPGDFVHVPPELVHRELNPGSEPCQVVLFRYGDGESVVNVSGPD